MTGKLLDGVFARAGEIQCEVDRIAYLDDAHDQWYEFCAAHNICGRQRCAFVLCHSSQVLARNVYKRSALMLQVVTEKFMLQVLQKIYAYVCSI